MKKYCIQNLHYIEKGHILYIYSQAKFDKSGSPWQIYYTWEGGGKCVEDARHACIDLAIILNELLKRGSISFIVLASFVSLVVEARSFDRSNTNRFDPIPFSLFFSSFLPSLWKRKKKWYISFGFGTEFTLLVRFQRSINSK